MWQSLLLVVLLSPVPVQAASQAAGSSCVTCHGGMGDPLDEAVKASSRDIHFKNGLSCHSCHGGDPSKEDAEAAMNPGKGFVRQPSRKQIIARCASCHSDPAFMRKFNPQARVDQYSEYLTSVHGKKSQEGDQKVAICIDCHGHHGILAARDPNSPVYPPNVAATCGRCHSDAKRMQSYGIKTDQQQLYLKSVHGEALMKQRDLAAPTCNSCHGNHGAAPPGVDSVANVCGQCHAIQWDLFNQSPHKKAFADGQLKACVTCHQNHEILRPTDAMLGTEEASTCILCHEQGSAGFAAAQRMKTAVAGLQSHISAAEQILTKAGRAGMEVSRPVYQLSEARDHLVLARVQVHRFDAATLAKTIAEGDSIAASCQQSGVQALADLAFRRKGLAVSAVILLGMIGLLLLKIRQIKNRL